MALKTANTYEPAAAEQGGKPGVSQLRKSPVTRRYLIAAALAAGATPIWAGRARASSVTWREMRARFPEGVASGDPTAESVLLWTRCPPSEAGRSPALRVEVATDPDFRKVVATQAVIPTAEADWTCRVLVAGLRPMREYWYRFTAADGAGSRLGRTITAPADDDPRDVRFAFVSCQNVNLGPLTAWRRMLYDDRACEPRDRLGFVLHLGDFIYDSVWRSAERPTYFDRQVRDVPGFPVGEPIDGVHVPITVDDYRALYRAYLHDPDLQAARARWPFVAIWDNGEFSGDGWQGLQRFGGVTRPAQTRKVAANQAWYEYLPSHARQAGPSVARFAAPEVEDAPVLRFDPDGLGDEPNNLAAIRSLTGYRTHRWGRHVELILTDQRTYRSEDFSADPAAKAMGSTTFPQMVPFETLQMIDAGRTWNAGQPPERLQFADREAPNFRRAAHPRTLLGAEQKAWFLNRLAKSEATWKIWGDTVATFDMRADPQHLPPGLTRPWPGKGYAGYARMDHSTAFAERAEIYDFVADRGITGFVTLSGDRHSFWAGRSAKSLPPEAFTPVGVAFVTGSISSPGMVEAFEHTLREDHPLRALYLIDRPGRSAPEASVNLLLKHGVRTCLEYAEHGDLARAKTTSDPALAPHVDFVDMGGHGYGVVHATATRVDVEFVCIPRPVEANPAPDGGPLRYRVTHSAQLWKAGEAPVLERTALSGDAELSA